DDFRDAEFSEEVHCLTLANFTRANIPREGQPSRAAASAKPGERVKSALTSATAIAKIGVPGETPGLRLKREDASNENYLHSADEHRCRNSLQRCCSGCTGLPEPAHYHCGALLGRRAYRHGNQA